MKPLNLLLTPVVLVAIAWPLTTPARAQPRPDPFKQYLQQHPEADTDRDGTLTRHEWIAHNCLTVKKEGLTEVRDQVKFVEDVEYLKIGDDSLKLDLYLPKAAGRGSGLGVGGGNTTQSEIRNPKSTIPRPPLVIWYHGGGWSEYNKDRCLIIWLAGQGYAVASVQYRLAPKATVPQLVGDCKAAIRWLRAHAEEYGYSAEKVGVAGESAGGHLAALLGTTGDDKQFDIHSGAHADRSTRVQAVLDIYGPSDLHGWLKAFNNVQLNQALFGGPIEQKAKEMQRVSPINHVTSDDAPILILHGDKDALVALDQSTRLHEACKAANVPSTLHVVQGSGHGGPAYTDPQRRKLIVEFFDQHLKGVTE